jgi:hypothetical protein
MKETGSVFSATGEVILTSWKATISGTRSDGVSAALLEIRDRESCFFLPSVAAR